jgi:hypothetical protein
MTRRVVVGELPGRVGALIRCGPAGDLLFLSAAPRRHDDDGGRLHGVRRAGPERDG